MEKPRLENKTYVVCTKSFTLHGREYKVGEMISYEKANELTKTMEELELIAPTDLETT